MLRVWGANINFGGAYFRNFMVYNSQSCIETSSLLVCKRWHFSLKPYLSEMHGQSPQLFQVSLAQLVRVFNKFLHKWVLKSNRWVYLPKARRVFDPRGVRGYAPPENFEVLDSRRCIFRSFFVALLFHFFAPKSTNLNKFEENYVTMK